MIFAIIFVLIVLFILVIFIQVDVKMTLRYKKGPKTQIVITNELGEKYFSNYGIVQPKSKYYTYEAEYYVNGKQKGIVYNKKKLAIGEKMQAPYWIEQDGQIELTPRTYMDRFIRFIVSAILAIICVAVLFATGIVG